MAYYIIKSKLSGLVLDIEAQGGSGSKVVPWDRHGGDNQIFFDDPATGTIRSKWNNCALTVENDQLYVKDVQPGNKAQQWVRQGDVIKNRNDNRVLDVFAENTEKGAQIGAYESNGGVNQKWEFEMVGGQAPGGQSASHQGVKKEFYIVSEMHGKVLDIAEEKTDPGAKVIMWDKHSPAAPNQLWYLDNQGLIRSSLSDLTISNGGKGQKIVTAKPSNDPRGQWQFQGKKIASKAGECLDISEENDSNGAELVSWEANGNVNQSWRQEFV